MMIAMILHFSQVSLQARPNSSQAAKSAPTAASTNPTFTKMRIVFHTTDEDKARDTRLEIAIIPVFAQRKSAVAYLDIGGTNLPNVPNKGFPADSTSDTYVVPASEPIALKDLLANYEIFLKITPNGHEMWSFGYDAVLRFRDGTTAKISMAPGSIMLSNIQENFRYSVTKLSEAHVTRP